MSASPVPAPASPAPAQPTQGDERLVLLDALRGFALCGVFVSNVFSWFAGRIFMNRAQHMAALADAPLLDHVARYTVLFFVSGKFISIFTFLFGLGFAVQLGRAEQRGAAIGPLYLRRLGVLLLIGLAHMSLLWHGDILNLYALLGFTLLLFRGRSDKALLLWAALLVLLVPTLNALFQRLWPMFASREALAMAREELERTAARNAHSMAVYAAGHYVEVVRTNVTLYLRQFSRLQVLAMLSPILGRFLLGLLVGRRRLFHDVAAHLPLFHKALRWGLVVGVLGSGAGLAVRQLTSSGVLTPGRLPWLPVVMSPVGHLGDLGLATFYVAGLSLLFQRPVWRRLLSVFEPVGRMALTNYLCQSVVSLFLFYGYGLALIGKASPSLCVGLSLGIFCVQAVLSHLWLRRFRFGPAEWVWRSLTYGEAQPMRRASALPSASSP